MIHAIFAVYGDPQLTNAMTHVIIGLDPGTEVFLGMIGAVLVCLFNAGRGK